LSNLFTHPLFGTAGENSGGKNSSKAVTKSKKTPVKHKNFLSRVMNDYRRQETEGGNRRQKTDDRKSVFSHRSSKVRLLLSVFSLLH